MQFERCKAAESFSIKFDGPAFDGRGISAVALAQSLLALDGLAVRMSQELYGADSKAEIKVTAGFKQGAFLVDLIIEKFQTDPLEASAAATGTLAGVVGGIKALIKLGKWALEVKVLEGEADGAPNAVRVENDIGQIRSFNLQVVNVYNNQRTMSQLSRLTQTLDAPGAESIRIIDPSDDSEDAVETISKTDRDLFEEKGAGRGGGRCKRLAAMKFS